MWEVGIRPNPIYHAAAIRDEGRKSRERTKAQWGLTRAARSAPEE